MAFVGFIRRRLSPTHQCHYIHIRLTLIPFQNMLFKFPTVTARDTTIIYVFLVSKIPFFSNSNSNLKTL